MKFFQNFERCPFLQICTVILLNITSTSEKAETINDICKIIFRRIRKNCLFEKCTEIIQDDVCVENVNIVELNIDENQNNILCSYNSVVILFFLFSKGVRVLGL